MAQTGYTPILIYSSSTASAAPVAGNLTNSTLGSELAINITDGKLFYKDNAGAVQVIGWKVVPATAGGTGLTSYTQGDLLYATSSTTLGRLADVATGNALISGGVGGDPAWGKIGLTTHVSGTLPVTNGGTGTATAFTAGSVVFAGASGVYSQSNAQFFWDNTNNRLGVGTDAPAYSMHIVRAGADASLAVQSSSSGAAIIRMFASTQGLAAFNAIQSIYGSTTSWSIGGNGSNDTIAFNTAGSERARIFASGGVSIGSTTDPGVGALNVTNNGWFGTNADLLASNRRLSVSGTCGASFRSTGGSGFVTLDVWNNATSGDNTFQLFFTETAATSRGSITYNRAGGLVAYNTTSDYRAKTIHGELTNSGNVIDALKVYEGTMNGASVARPMMLAHEAQIVAPYSVTGEKDEVNEDGTPKYQQMDHASYVPLLIAELQSLRKRVAELESK